MPNGGHYGQDDEYRTREEMVGAEDVVIAAKKALERMGEQDREIESLMKKVEQLNRAVNKLKLTIKTLRNLDKE